jgi:hypothetical protein
MKLVLLVSVSCICINIVTSSSFSEFISTFKPKKLSQREENAKPRVNNLILCGFRKHGQTLGNHNCYAQAFNFTFSANFHNKNLLRTKNMRRLAHTLSQNSICETKFMKYLNFGQRMTYFDSDDGFYWYENKKLNHTSSPNVYITHDPDHKKKRIIIFECKLPRSDVFMSMNYHMQHDDQYKPIHGHPLPNYRVTVSGLHVKLNFMQMDNLVINLNQNKNHNYENTDSTFINMARNKFLSNRAPIERYFVFYDTKCRTCSHNGSLEHLNLLENDSLQCDLNVSFCYFL